MSNNNLSKKKAPFNTISLIIILLFIVILTIIVLINNHNHLKFYTHSNAKYLGSYDYERIMHKENPNYYQIIIKPNRSGYMRPRRTTKTASADLAVRLGYHSVTILSIKKNNNKQDMSTITAQVYLDDNLSSKKHDPFRSPFRARDYLAKESYIVFLEDELQPS